MVKIRNSFEKLAPLRKRLEAENQQASNNNLLTVLFKVAFARLAQPRALEHLNSKV